MANYSKPVKLSTLTPKGTHDSVYDEKQKSSYIIDLLSRTMNVVMIIVLYYTAFMYGSQIAVLIATISTIILVLDILENGITRAKLRHRASSKRRY